jgi:hypothetical protein
MTIDRDQINPTSSFDERENPEHAFERGFGESGHLVMGSLLYSCNMFSAVWDAYRP